MFYECYSPATSTKKIVVSAPRAMNCQTRYDVQQTNQVFASATITVVDLKTREPVPYEESQSVIQSYLRSNPKIVNFGGTNVAIAYQVEADNLQAVLVAAAFPEDVLAAYLEEIKELRKPDLENEASLPQPHHSE
jgi:hypothetical protein